MKDDDIRGEVKSVLDSLKKQYSRNQTPQQKPSNQTLSKNSSKRAFPKEKPVEGDKPPTAAKNHVGESQIKKKWTPSGVPGGYRGIENVESKAPLPTLQKNSGSTSNIKQKDAVGKNAQVSNVVKNNPAANVEKHLSEVLSAQISSVSGKLGQLQGQKWYECIPAIEEKSKSDAQPSTEDNGKFKRVAEALFNKEVELGNKLRSSSSSSQANWMKTVLVSGTSSDKLAAYTLLIADSPMLSISYLDSLLSIARHKSRREASMAIEALRDLFTSNLLPDNRKLMFFSERPFHMYQRTKLTKEHLIFWFFEDLLKRKYNFFVEILSMQVSSDNVSHFKISSLRIISDLLVYGPENELGDPESKVASKTQFLLLRIAEKHSAMKPVLVREVRQFLYRPNVSTNGTYYAMLFLSQLPLQVGQSSLAHELVITYFSIFESMSKQQQGGENRKPTEKGKKAKAKHANKEDMPHFEVESINPRILSALLTGINRAYPYAHGDDTQASIESHADVLFTVAHAKNFNVAVQTLLLIQQIASKQLARAAASGEGSSNSSFSDRFYRSLYGFIDYEYLDSTSKLSLFLNLVYKSIKADPVIGRAISFLKRLLMVAGQLSARFACGALLLTSETLKDRPELRGSVSGWSVNELRCPASFFKRSIDPTSVASSKSNTDFMEEEEQEEETRNLELERGGNGIAGEDMVMNLQDSEESEEEEDAGEVEKPTPSSVPVPASSTHLPSEEKFDPLKRDPRFAGGETSFLWELLPLATHFHPSVRKFASEILVGNFLSYKGDPLADFSLMAFLDRYVFKQPKKAAGMPGASLSEGSSPEGMRLCRACSMSPRSIRLKRAAPHSSTGPPSCSAVGPSAAAWTRSCLQMRRPSDRRRSGSFAQRTCSCTHSSRRRPRLRSSPRTRRRARRQPLKMQTRTRWTRSLTSSQMSCCGKLLDGRTRAKTIRSTGSRTRPWKEEMRLARTRMRMTLRMLISTTCPKKRMAGMTTRRRRRMVMMQMRMTRMVVKTTMKKCQRRRRRRRNLRNLGTRKRESKVLFESTHPCECRVVPSWLSESSKH
jgi:CBF/Mak21 family